MSRMSDLQGLLRGFEQLAVHFSRISCHEASALASTVSSSTLVRPIAAQAVQTLLGQQQRTGESPPPPNPKRVSPEDLMQNVPLVLEGAQIFLTTMAGLSPAQCSIRSTGGVRDSGPTGNAAAESGSIPRRFHYEVDRSISSLDLLNVDLTNEALLRDKLLKKVFEISAAAASVPPDIGGPNAGTTVAATSTAIVSSTAATTAAGIAAAEQRTVEKPLPMIGPKLSPQARERSVPASRLSRVLSFGSLGVGLGLGVVAEASRRAVGLSKAKGDGSGPSLEGSLILNEANAERIVSTLCRVRGAALKMGQILSIQDNSIMSPELSAIFDRVRESADFMPLWQLDKVMTGEMGQNWREKFDSFDTTPFAAASIGQVHMAKLKDGTAVAVKVQYPGVAKSIQSDIRNLMSLLSVVAFLPKGLFIDNIAKHMEIELAQECDYIREAECGRRMRDVLSQYPEYYVPRVYSELSTRRVLTTEYITGLTIDRCVELPQETRNHIAESILKLVFRELFLHRYMQTDPNWANFLYNPATDKIGLLDFGATREYKPSFVNTYFRIIDAAAHKDRDSVLKYSRDIGFLTGYESKVMNEAHVNSVMLLAVPFHTDADFDFGKQTITQEIQDLSGVMLEHRLCPPPPEVYSLHRKLSGLFLLAGKLNSKFNCYRIWKEIRSRFKSFSG